MPRMGPEQLPGRPRSFVRTLLWPALSGVALALAFPPAGLWPLVFVAWVPLWHALSQEGPFGGRRAWYGRFLQGWTMGFVGFLGVLHWLVALSNEEVSVDGLMIPALILLSLYLGLFFGLAALISSRLAKTFRLPMVVVAPLVVLLCEYLRAQGPLGMTWGAPGYALARVVPLIQSASLWGFWGLVFFVLAVNAALSAGLRGRRLGFLLAFLLLGGAWGGGLLAMRHADQTASAGREINVLVAQPDIRREIKWKPQMREEIVETVMAHAQTAVREASGAERLDLFVWPETVFPLRLTDDPGVLARVFGFADEIGAPILMGTQEGYWQTIGPRREWVAHNSAVVVSPGRSLSQAYRKIKLVPFSERMPLQKVAPWIKDVDFGQSNFFPGEGPILLAADSTRIGTLICFEAAFPDLPREFVNAGAGLLVNITNDFWFERTAGPRQHADMSILRAVENRVPLLRCANTGISFQVDRLGRVSHETGLFTRTSFLTSVTVGGGSVAPRLGDWWVAVVAVALLLLVLAGLWRRP